MNIYQTYKTRDGEIVFNKKIENFLLDLLDEKDYYSNIEDIINDYNTIEWIEYEPTKKYLANNFDRTKNTIIYQIFIKIWESDFKNNLINMNYTDEFNDYLSRIIGSYLLSFDEFKKINRQKEIILSYFRCLGLHYRSLEDNKTKKKDDKITTGLDIWKDLDNFEMEGKSISEKEVRRINNMMDKNFEKLNLIVENTQEKNLEIVEKCDILKVPKDKTSNYSGGCANQ